MQINTIFDNTPAELASRSVLRDDIASVRMARAFRLYYRLRPFLPLALRQRMQKTRNQRLDVPVDWYLPNEFFSLISGELENGSCDILHPWPDRKQFCFVLTHDVETADGMRDVAALADIEEGLGFRSSWNLVPHKYTIDRGLVRDLQSRGFEIGVHGFNHDGNLFSSEAIFRKRAIAINQALYDFDAVGFRAPMVHRNLDWLQQLDIEYDASCFDIDPFQAMPGGIGSIWPAIVGKFVELPYTLPQDHTLFVSLGEETTRIWRDKLEFIKSRSGMALMLTHPDYLDSPQRKLLYRDFLAEVRDAGDFWHDLPREVARWWRAYVQADSREDKFLRAKLHCQDGEFRIEAISESKV